MALNATPATAREVSEYHVIYRDAEGIDCYTVVAPDGAWVFSTRSVNTAHRRAAELAAAAVQVWAALRREDE